MKHVCANNKNKIAYRDDCLNCKRRCAYLSKSLPIKYQKIFMEWLFDSPIDFIAIIEHVKIDLFFKAKKMSYYEKARFKKISKMTDKDRRETHDRSLNGGAAGEETRCNQ